MSREDDASGVTRTMDLLWRSDGPRPDAPGPEPRLSVADVVEAAVAVADANGSAGVSMRAVAEALGVTPMTLYGYVPDKDALLALMYDAVHAEIVGQRGEGDWQERVIASVEDLVDLYVRHPWTLQFSYARPVLGPHEQQALEMLILVLRESGLGPSLLRRVTGMLLHAVEGTARTIVEAREAAMREGTSDGEWWEGRSSALSAVSPDFAERFPNTTWLFSVPDEGPTGGDVDGYVDREARANLRIGVQTVLDGMLAPVGDRS